MMSTQAQTGIVTSLVRIPGGGFPRWAKEIPPTHAAESCAATQPKVWRRTSPGYHSLASGD